MVLQKSSALIVVIALQVRNKHSSCLVFYIAFVVLSTTSLPFFTRFNAEAASYNSTQQCCKAASENTACTTEYQLVQCGNHPDYCTYTNKCIASAAGWSESDCCAVADESACTNDNTPQFCGDNNCYDPSESCAEAAGYVLKDCCKVPKDTGACTANRYSCMWKQRLHLR